MATTQGQESRAPGGSRPAESVARDVGDAPSKAAIGGHPIHPMIIPFPIALLAAAPVTDIAFAVTGAALWAQMSFWLIAGGLLTGAIAAVVGMIDFVGVRRVRTLRAGWIHLGTNVAVLSLALVNLWIRAGVEAQAVVPSGLLLSLVTAALLMVSGWYGGELTYRHRIGVSGPEAVRQPAKTTAGTSPEATAR